MEKKRIEWIDVARCIGIYMVFIGHFGAAVGRTQPFVFEFHVPLFFFLAGCTENFQKSLSFLDGVKKKIKRLIFPWIVFVFCLYY